MDVFRPPRALRAGMAVLGTLSGLGSLWALAQAVHSASGRSAAGALVLALPALIAAGIVRRRVTVEDAGLRSTTLLGSRLIPWAAFRWMDQTRRSFVAVTDRGHVSGGWIARRDRDRLMRLIMQRAKLVFSQERLRYGVRARYVPRAKPITLTPGPPKPDGGPPTAEGKQDR